MIHVYDIRYSTFYIESVIRKIATNVYAIESFGVLIECMFLYF